MIRTSLNESKSWQAGVEVEIEDADSKKTVFAGLAELSLKTGLVVRSVDSAAVIRLFAELDKYDPDERSETSEYLKHALNETRRSVGAEPIYRDT